MRIIIKEFEDVAMIPPKIRKRNRGGGGDNYNYIYQYYGRLTFPDNFFNLLNNSYQNSSKAFQEHLNDVVLIDQGVKISDHTSKSIIYKDSETFNLEGYVATIEKHSNIIHYFKKLLISKLASFNDEETISNNELPNLFNSRGITISFGFREEPEELTNDILNMFF